MAIQTETTDMQDSVQCGNLHMIELHLHQNQRALSSEPMNMSLSLAYRKYGVVDDVITTHSEARTIVVDDYLAEATSKAIVGDMRLIEAITAIEAAVAVIIEDAGIEGACVVN